MRLVITAELPDELLNLFLQHIRGFDNAFKGQCHFSVIGEGSMSIEQIVEALKIRPGFSDIVVKQRGDPEYETSQQLIERLLKRHFAEQRVQTPSITCPKCGRTSCHPKDIEHRYCSSCGYHADFDFSDRVKQ